jgi:hypothetical protein
MPTSDDYRQMANRAAQIAIGCSAPSVARALLALALTYMALAVARRDAIGVRLMDGLRMCIPLCLRSAWRNRGSHIFCRSNVRRFTDARAVQKMTRWRNATQGYNS